MHTPLLLVFSFTVNDNKSNCLLIVNEEFWKFKIYLNVFSWLVIGFILIKQYTTLLSRVSLFLLLFRFDTSRFYGSGTGNLSLPHWDQPTIKLNKYACVISGEHKTLGFVKEKQSWYYETGEQYLVCFQRLFFRQPISTPEFRLRNTESRQISWFTVNTV